MEKTKISVGRPRSQQAHQAILRAARRAFCQQPFAEVSIEGIAASAGVGKTTIYRRWPNKTALAVAVLLQEALSAQENLESHSFFDHLVEGMYGLYRLLSGELGGVIAAVIAETQHDTRLRGIFFQGFLGKMESMGEEELTAAVERGEIDPSIDTQMTFDQMFGTLHFRALILKKPVTKQYVARLVQSVVGPYLRPAALSPQL